MDLIVGVNKGSITNVPQDDTNTTRAIDGAIAFHATPDGIATFVSSDEGKTVEVIPVAPGTVVFTTSADADLSPTSSKAITGNPITVNVAAAPIPQATHIVSTEGAVVPQ